MPDHTTCYRVKEIFKEYFEGISVIEQAQLLNMLLKRKCLRNAMTLLGIKNVKEAKSNEIVSQNLTAVLSSLAKKRSHNYMVARKSILTGVVAKNIVNSHFLSTTARMLKTARKSLWKHKNVRVQLDEDDEVACWGVICRKPYQDRLPYSVRDKVKLFLHLNYPFLQNENDVCDIVYQKETMKIMPNA